MRLAARLLTLPSFLIAAFALTACGGGGGGSGSDPADPAPLPGLYVDAVNGSNGNDGSYDRPYKTITRAITAAGVGDTIRVRAGTYDAALGESFPIRPGFGVTIVGSGSGRLMLTRIVGGALWSGDPDHRLHAAVVPGPDNHLVHLSIQNPQPFVPGAEKPAAVVLAFSGVTVEDCALHDSDKGVRMVAGVTGALLKSCTLSANLVGLLVDGAGLNNRSEGCTYTGNSVGVMNFTGGVDFGDGPFGSGGGNAFTANTSNDFVHFAGTTEQIFAGRCFWDAAPPTMAVGNPAPIANADIWVVSGGMVMAGGAQLYQPGPAVIPPGGGVVVGP